MVSAPRRFRSFDHATTSKFCERHDVDDKMVVSQAFIFQADAGLSEAQFENYLWQRLAARRQGPRRFQHIHECRRRWSEGAITVKAPLSKAGDYIVLVAEMDLIVALTACSAQGSLE